MPNHAYEVFVLLCMLRGGVESITGLKKYYYSSGYLLFYIPTFSINLFLLTQFMFGDCCGLNG